jgi:hypothetical protein
MEKAKKFLEIFIFSIKKFFFSDEQKYQKKKGKKFYKIS